MLTFHGQDRFHHRRLLWAVITVRLSITTVRNGTHSNTWNGPTPASPTLWTRALTITNVPKLPEPLKITITTHASASYPGWSRTWILYKSSETIKHVDWHRCVKQVGLNLQNLGAYASALGQWHTSWAIRSVLAMSKPGRIGINGSSGTPKFVSRMDLTTRTTLRALTSSMTMWASSTMKENVTMDVSNLRWKAWPSAAPAGRCQYWT